MPEKWWYKSIGPRNLEAFFGDHGVWFPRIDFGLSCLVSFLNVSVCTTKLAKSLGETWDSEFIYDDRKSGCHFHFKGAVSPG